jgi:general secretion pathway protein E
VTGLPVLTADDYPDTPVLPEQISLRFLKEFHLVGIAADEFLMTHTGFLEVQIQ